MNRNAIEFLDGELEEKGELTFETRGKLLTLATEIIAFRYLKYLEQCRDKADKNSLDFKYWNARIYTEVEAYERALRNILTAKGEKKAWERTRIKLTHNSKLIKMALKSVGVRDETGIPMNVTYVIDLKENKLRRCVH